ncbi:trypsin-like peptidase domain-containing protein [Pseudoflavitalea sp. G-6-1-2]|uniref:S1C family serine protease n=1 Tax=Pseudoflavitalea sp. G-6-1-2 TaxID=2728841 RepID=UPI00146C3DBA|nr:serine protease [Pseudoflavitalea sp. G-6-1-2]NML23321.1 trypsin-like peptidase domain-containing protein [Pseudoflavitalea sp. G-6-1-2]
MEDLQLMDAIERYLRNEMPQEEKAHFEQLRKSNPEIDQLVVEHTMFLQQMDQFGEWKNLKSTLQDVHHQLTESGEITETAPKATVVSIFRKYKKVMGVAASIAGITTLLIAGGVSWYTRQASNAELQQLRREFKIEVANKKNEVLDEVISKISKAPVDAEPISGGTGFLIDGKGYLVTNAHVIKGGSTFIVQNNKGQEFRAQTAYVNYNSDVAILKISDDDFKVHSVLPYSFRKGGSDLGEPLFTLGFPREEIVYNEGYMSAKTGYNGDTLTCQIGVPANPGNSGGPVFNRNGEVIGIINTRLKQAEGVVFALTAKNIIRTLETIKKEDSTFRNLKLPSNTQIKGMDRVQQIKKIEDCVFMVKSY